ncbi:hypothetical protein Hdeb2414_s0006g00217991 [Helianthus debilis subsp. tardiflorus]
MDGSFEWFNYYHPLATHNPNTNSPTHHLPLFLSLFHRLAYYLKSHPQIHNKSASQICCILIRMMVMRSAW